ncbi:RNA polymerase I-specific transcription initiation factor-domain-containing protein [Aspergillus avenaceus]|uniref:RNA polymerase I-specific transcription initiation factor-domain-containing protein n=1 Tax=Aspergillus avenaceus TaxID=36643 RepID=A0A5N6U2W5_ASPAV|nr:RNA polymerase I-specific transcription initiation factor-domain-containing protein [Aspergillus avenaceus]
MSSVSGNLSPHHLPPQSAQPFRSLFGGSSQDVVDHSSPPRGHQFNPDDLDVIMEDLPVIPDNSSDDSYRESDEEKPRPSNNTTAKLLPKKDTKIATTTTATTTAATTTTYSDSESELSASAYRPNRFQGSESAWRKLTAQDRQNAEALEEIRARDLAAHLYNAYALRVRARELVKRAAEGGSQDDDNSAFVPPKRWAAWPLPASDVPRGNEHTRRAPDEAWTMRMLPDPRPSADLEESIMATMMKVAKERFHARPSDPKYSAVQQWISSQPGTQDDTATDADFKTEPEYDDGVYLHPVVQADDDKSRAQLRPLTRNILTKLDGLLMGLHYARKGVAGADDSSESEGQTDTESVSSNHSSTRRRGKGSTERSLSRGRKRTRRSSGRTGSSNHQSAGRHVSSERTTSRRSLSQRSESRNSSSKPRGRSAGSDHGQSRNRARLGLRDWSEVLGVASMVGFPPSVVMRSAQRCAALFGEDMEFQILQEGTLQQVQEEDVYNWQYADNESEASDAPPPAPALLKGSPPRTSSPKRAASTRPASPEAEATGDVFRPRGKGQHRKKDLVCPITTCPRNANGFARRWNLNLHLKRMHPGYQARGNDSKIKSAAVISAEEDSDVQ